MRIMKRMLTALLSLLMIFSLQIPAKAAERTGYTYMVRLYSGQQGTFKSVGVTVVRGNSVIPLSFGSSDTITIKGLMYNDRINIDVDTNSIELGEESKYYVRGIRESGKDNETIESSGARSRSASSSAAASFEVKGDADYVVGYGLLADAVSYTVNYVDTEGNTLAPSRVYYGNVGDKPVVAYLYIDGYQPQAYNITGTLNVDASKNVFTFIYTPVAPGTVITETIVTPGTVVDLGTQVITGGGTGGTTGAGGAGAGGTAGTGGAAGAGGAAGTGGAADAGAGDAGEADAGANLPDDQPPLDAGTPEDTLDMDEGDSPLANFVNDSVENVTGVVGDAVLLFSGVPMAGKAAIIVGAVGVIPACIWGIIYYRKKKKNEQKES